MAGKSKTPCDQIRLERTRPQHPRARAERVAAATMAETVAAQKNAVTSTSADCAPAPVPSGARVFTLYGAPPRPPVAPEPEAAEVETDGGNVALDFYRRLRP